jgi:large subunit ribosomal protein L5
MSRLQQKYQQEIVPKLCKELKIKSPMALPRMTKIVISAGLGASLENPKLMEIAKSNIADITGQAPVVTYSKKAISGFKLRANQPIGLKVTLRGARMYEFLDRFNNSALARIRDFRGINPKSFDSNGNLNIGIKEHTIFPEISFEKTELVHGLQVTIVFHTNNNELNMSLMKELGMPFEKPE